jgi:HSP20 family protein
MALLVRRQDLTPPPIQRWQPFPEIQEVQEQMGQLMERLLSRPEAAPWVPLVDIVETDDSWVVEAEVPGVKREDIDVEVGESEIAITGEVKEREREGIFRRRTRRVGRFEFRVTPPGPMDPEKVEADLADGVLTIRIPKPEMARPRHVEVRSAQRPDGQGAQAGQPALGGEAAQAGPGGPSGQPEMAPAGAPGPGPGARPGPGPGPGPAAA